MVRPLSYADAVRNTDRVDEISIQGVLSDIAPSDTTDTDAIEIVSDSGNGSTNGLSNESTSNSSADKHALLTEVALGQMAVYWRSYLTPLAVRTDNTISQKNFML